MIVNAQPTIQRFDGTSAPTALNDPNDATAVLSLQQQAGAVDLFFGGPDMLTSFPGNIVTVPLAPASLTFTLGPGEVLFAYASSSGIQVNTLLIPQG